MAPSSRGLGHSAFIAGTPIRIRVGSQMKLPNYVRPKPGFFKYIPALKDYTANSIYPWIFIPRDIYDDLKSDVPNDKHVALLIHESTHYKRQKSIGWFKFGIKYLIFSEFRFNEELVAVKEAMKYLKSKKIKFDFDRKARHLSSHLYLWPVSKEYAEKQLRRVWNEI